MAGADHDHLGIASTATAFATGENSLYVLRLLVGIAEAGFVPGVLLYLTYWFPQAYRARANGFFMIAQPWHRFRFAALRLHPADGRRPWPRRMALAVRHRRRALDRARRLHVLLFEERPAGCGMAQRGGETVIEEQLAAEPLATSDTAASGRNCGAAKSCSSALPISAS